MVRGEGTGSKRTNQGGLGRGGGQSTRGAGPPRRRRAAYDCPAGCPAHGAFPAGHGATAARPGGEGRRPPHPRTPPAAPTFRHGQLAGRRLRGSRGDGVRPKPLDWSVLSSFLLRLRSLGTARIQHRLKNPSSGVDEPGDGGRHGAVTRTLCPAPSLGGGGGETSELGGPDRTWQPCLPIPCPVALRAVTLHPPRSPPARTSGYKQRPTPLVLTSTRPRPELRPSTGDRVRRGPCPKSLGCAGTLPAPWGHPPPGTVSRRDQPRPGGAAGALSHVGTHGTDCKYVQGRLPSSARSLPAPKQCPRRTWEGGGGERGRGAPGPHPRPPWKPAALRTTHTAADTAAPARLRAVPPPPPGVAVRRGVTSPPPTPAPSKGL